MRKLIAIALLFTSIASQAWGGNIPATFYVDATSGSDNASTNTGLATDNAWKTVAKVNAFSRTNLTKQSEDLSTTWINARTTESTNADVAPDGNTTADRLISDATAATTHYISDYYGTSHAINTYHTVSAYLKAGAGTYSTWVQISFADKAGVFRGTYANLSTGALGTADADSTTTITSAGDGWYRVSSTQFSGTGSSEGYFRIFMAEADGDNSFSGDNTSYILVFGAQREVGSLPTPYVPTTTTAVTASFQPGDSVLFKRGQTWDETLTVPSSGTSGAHITYGSYSGGRKPLITAVDLNGQTYVDVSFKDLWKIPSFPDTPSFPAR
jgi:hypothetical protein